MKLQKSWNILKFTILFVLTLYLSGCTSFGPTKPNSPYAGNSHPVILNKLAQNSPLLVKELGRLPEIQDGVSETEMSSLNTIVELYKSNSADFEYAFNEMYKVGKPDLRKYCTPLQALFWLIEDGKKEKANYVIKNYSLESLLVGWFAEPRVLSEEQVNTLIDFIKDESNKRDYFQLFKRVNNGKFLEYFSEDIKKKPEVFKKGAKKYLKEIRDQNLNFRWKDFNIIADRLNAPELLDFYIDQNITYKHIIPAYHRPPRSVIEDKYGDCDDLAYLGKTVLSKAGYNTFGRFLNRGRWPNHIGLGIKLEDGSFLKAVDFGGDSRNRMSGPYKTILEFDRALGYGRLYQTRGSFYFNW